MSDNWEDKYVIGNEAKKSSTGAHGSPVPLAAKQENWEDKYAITKEVKKEAVTKEDKKYTPSPGPSSDLAKVFGPINKFMRKLPLGLDTMEKKINPSLVKGIPIAGNFVPQTEELSKFEENNPIGSGALRVAGGVGSMLPMAAGVAGNIANKAIPQAMGQGMLGGTLGFTDTAVGNKVNEEQANPDTSFMLGALGGAGGSLLGKAITPKTPSEFSMYKVGNRPTKEPNLSRADREFRSHMGDPKVEKSMQMLEETLKKGIKKSTSTPAPETAENITNALMRAGVGGVISHASGMGPIPGIVIGATYPKIPGWSKKITNKWYNNKLMNKPYPKHESFPPYFPSEDASQINRFLLNSLGMELGQ